MNQQISYPNLVSREAGVNTERKIREIIDSINSLTHQTASNTTAISNVKVPSYTEISNNLQIGGAAPLDLTGLQGGSGAIYAGTHADRLSSNVSTSEGVLYYETDRNMMYYFNGSGWIYLFGDPFKIVSPSVNALNGTMTDGDIGFAIQITDEGNIVYRYGKLLFSTVWKYESGGPDPVGYIDVSGLVVNGILGIVGDSLGMKDDGVLIKIADRGNVVFSWNGAGSKWYYVSGGPCPIAYADITNLITYGMFGLSGDSLGVKDTGLPIQITDRGNVIYTWNGTNFVYTSGSYYGLTQSGLAALSFVGGALTVRDDGVTVHITDYDHYLIWVGATLNWAWLRPPDDGLSAAGPIHFEAAPTAGVWHLYDGATVNYLKPDGTTGSVALGTIANSYFRQ
jgi:hypothetical protein